MGWERWGRYEGQGTEWDVGDIKSREQVGVGDGGILRQGTGGVGWGMGVGPNSKHLFTTSFLQPLPYLVTP